MVKPFSFRHYIEKDGKVYTLPVTQGKYKQMMHEVQQNHGMNVDISQSVEDPRPDLRKKKEKEIADFLLRRFCKNTSSS